MKVVDASAMIDVLTGTTRSAQLRSLFDDDLFAPDLLIAQVFSFLKRMTTARRLSRPEADQLALTLRQAPIEYLPTWPYAEHVWTWRDNLSCYDAVYVALASDLRAPLVTTDAHLAKAAADLVAVLTV